MPFGDDGEEPRGGNGPRVPSGRRRRHARARGASGRCFARCRSRTSRRRSTSTTPRASGTRFGAVPGVDADAIAARLDDDDVVEEYERQRAEARSAAGTPAEAQDKTATSDGLVRFTAPSIVFRRGEDTVVAGGWQPLLAYDTLLANFAPDARAHTASRIARAAPRVLPARADDGRGRASPRRGLGSGSGLRRNGAPTLDLVESGVAERVPLGRDALWRAPRSRRSRRGPRRRRRPVVGVGARYVDVEPSPSIEGYFLRARAGFDGSVHVPGLARDSTPRRTSKARQSCAKPTRSGLDRGTGHRLRQRHLHGDLRRDVSVCSRSSSPTM